MRKSSKATNYLWNFLAARSRSRSNVPLRVAPSPLLADTCTQSGANVTRNAVITGWIASHIRTDYDNVRGNLWSAAASDVKLKVGMLGGVWDVLRRIGVALCCCRMRILLLNSWVRWSLALFALGFDARVCGRNVDELALSINMVYGSAMPQCLEAAKSQL